MWQPSASFVIYVCRFIFDYKNLNLNEYVDTRQSDNTFAGQISCKRTVELCKLAQRYRGCLLCALFRQRTIWHALATRPWRSIVTRCDGSWQDDLSWLCTLTTHALSPGYCLTLSTEQPMPYITSILPRSVNPGTHALSPGYCLALSTKQPMPYHLGIASLYQPILMWCTLIVQDMHKMKVKDITLLPLINDSIVVYKNNRNHWK